MKYVYTILVAILFIGCSSTKYVKEDALLYYGKTPCLGKCPVFDMYVFDDGKVLYEGLKNVDLLGIHEFNLTAEEVKNIKQELEEINFSSEERLRRDLPNTVLKYKGKKLSTQSNEQVKELTVLLDKIKK